MTDMDFVLLCLGLAAALSVIFIGKRSGVSIRNPAPPANHVKPAPPPPPPLTHAQRMREREVAAIESMTAPESRLAAILKANKHKFDIDRDGVIHIKLDHPEVIAEMRRQIESMSDIRSRSG